MTNPQFKEEKPLCLVDVLAILENLEKRDKELNFASKKCKEYVQGFTTLTPEKKEDLYKKLVDLKLTRLKDEHFMKIIDFLPRNVNDLKIVLQAYPLSLPKKDQDTIIQTVEPFLKA